MPLHLHLFHTFAFVQATWQRGMCTPSHTAHACTRATPAYTCPTPAILPSPGCACVSAQVTRPTPAYKCPTPACTRPTPAILPSPGCACVSAQVTRRTPAYTCPTPAYTCPTPAILSQVTRASGAGPTLLLLPTPGTRFEAWRPLRGDDASDSGFGFEGHHELLLHSAAWAANEWWGLGCRAE
eukprot:365163-Chlamydomonas_euryale.AAC.2